MKARQKSSKVTEVPTATQARMDEAVDDLHAKGLYPSARAVGAALRGRAYGNRSYPPLSSVECEARRRAFVRLGLELKR